MRFVEVLLMTMTSHGENKIFVAFTEFPGKSKEISTLKTYIHPIDSVCIIKIFKKSFYLPQHCHLHLKLD